MEMLFATAESITSILKLLGDKTRIKILTIVEHRESCVCEFVEVFESSQPAISQHLRKLKDAGLVKERKKGQWVYYSLNKESEYYSIIQSVLSHVSERVELLKSVNENSPIKRSMCDC